MVNPNVRFRRVVNECRNTFDWVSQDIEPGGDKQQQSDCGADSAEFVAVGCEIKDRTQNYLGVVGEGRQSNSEGTLQMFNSLRTAFAVLVLVLFAHRAGAASTTNYTDQWWNPNESGWGAAGTQQGDTIFFNVFVFDSDRIQTSFTSAAVYQETTAQGHLIFSGDLYLVSGPYFGGPFDPATVSSRKVGTLTFDADSVNTARLSYSVDGIVVTKNVTRQLWRFENFTGNYYGGLIYDASQCSTASNNGHYEELGTINIDHRPDNSVTLTSQTPGGSCTYAATYTQAGHMGTMQGSYSCTNGITGSFAAFELEKSISGMMGRFVAQNNLCQSVTGRLGGLQR